MSEPELHNEGKPPLFLSDLLDTSLSFLPFNKKKSFPPLFPRPILPLNSSHTGAPRMMCRNTVSNTAKEDVPHADERIRNRKRDRDQGNGADQAAHHPEHDSGRSVGRARFRSERQKVAGVPRREQRHRRCPKKTNPFSKETTTDSIASGKTIFSRLIFRRPKPLSTGESRSTTPSSGYMNTKPFRFRERI